MNLGLSPNELALQQRARKFANGTVRKRGIEIDRTGEYPWDVVEAMKAEGFLGMTIPRKYCGQGASFLDAVLVIEELGKACTVASRIAVETNMGAISAVMQYGSDEQKKLAAQLVLSGDKPAICITEPDAGSDTTSMGTRADKRGDAYVINGRKHWITGAGVSKLHLIFAKVFDEQSRPLGIAGFLVVREKDKGLKFVKREPTMGLRGMPEGELAFENIEVPASMMLTPPSGIK